MKKNGGSRVGIVAHLARMLGVVAPDTVDAAHGKAQVAAGDRQRRRRTDVDGVLRIVVVRLHLHYLQVQSFVRRQSSLMPSAFTTFV